MYLLVVPPAHALSSRVQVFVNQYFFFTAPRVNMWSRRIDFYTLLTKPVFAVVYGRRMCINE